MRIGLISDTHIPEVTRVFPPEVMQAFDGVDLILHAGDVYDPAVLDELECIAPVFAARGDDDYWPESKDDKRVKERHVLSLDSQALWLVHARSYWLMKEVKDLMESQERNGIDIPNIIVHGHLHRPSIEHANGILVVNSGSPTFLEYRSGLGTVGILTINSGQVDAHIVWL